MSEDQALWIVSGSEKTIQSLFQDWRFERLANLNMSEPNYDKGRLIQDEIAALHRLERQILFLREAAVKKEPNLTFKQEK